MNKAFLSSLLVCALATGAAPAATITLETSDTGSVSSLTSGTNWSDGNVPSGNDYVVGGGLTIQTPTDAVAHTFAGDSLTIGDGSAAAAIFAYKGTASSTITVNGLAFDNGVFQNGVNSSTIIPTLAGTINLLSGGGAFDMVGSNRNMIISAIISGSGPLLLENSSNGVPSASGGITIKGANTYTGATTIGANTKVTVGNANAFSTSSSMTLNSGSVLEGGNQTFTINNLSGTGGIIDENATNGTMTINETADGTFAGAITYTGGVGNGFSVTKTGAGTLTLSGANTWNNAATINGGTLKIDASTGSLASTVNLKMNGGAFDYDNANTTSGAKSQSLAGLIVGAGDNTVQSVLGGASSSTLSLAAVIVPAATTKATVNFVVSGGTNGTSNSIFLSNVTSGSTTITSGFLSGAMFFNGADYAYLDTGGFVRAAVYDVDAGFANAGSSLVANNHNQVLSSITSQGVVTVNTIKFSGTSAVDLTMSGSSVLTLANNGILRSGGGATLISGGSIATSVASTLYFIRTDSAADSLTISSTITGNTNGLVKSGAGTLILSGMNSYGGATTVNAGTLLVNGSPTAASAVTVNSGATFGGTGTIKGTLTLASGGFVAPGASGAVGTLTVNSASFTWNGGGTLDFDLGTASSDLLKLSGAFTKGTAGLFTFDFNALGTLAAGSTYTLIDFGSMSGFSASDFSASGASGTFSLNGSDLQFTVAAVPEPGTYGLIALGGIVLLALGYRRRAVAA